LTQQIVSIAPYLGTGGAVAPTNWKSECRTLKQLTVRVHTHCSDDHWPLRPTIPTPNCLKVLLLMLFFSFSKTRSLLPIQSWLVRTLIVKQSWHYLIWKLFSAF